ncbi:O-methyltransferase [Aeromicrobium sp. CTD01-1L150]|uniref:O-methyltransferase n=1 Tax=Aeromicrobium sp. CTD01-1L150 TaxID=3341830 RepID=UPI0035BF8181
MTNAASLQFAEDLLDEDEHLAEARQRAEDVGVSPVGTGTGATLQFLISLLEAKAVVEIGTGTGVSGLWLLRGMGRDGILTSVDLEAENQRHAREVFTAAGILPQRFRLITGSALEVLPRLTDNAYDLVLIDADKVEYAEYLEQALRLVRPGGVIVVDNTLWHDRVADPTQRDPQTVAIRELIDQVVADERLVPVLLPVGDGLLAATRRR